jgi:hypothetical protein
VLNMSDYMNYTVSRLRVDINKWQTDYNFTPVATSSIIESSSSSGLDYKFGDRVPSPSKPLASPSGVSRVYSFDKFLITMFTACIFL